MMKKYTLLTLIALLSIGACNNPNQKEIGEVEGLINIVNDTEKSLLSVDTSVVFTAKRQMENDLDEFNKVSDTLTREEAFKLDDIFGSKKRMQKLMTNYTGFMHQIEFSKTQLNNLKQDLENGVMSKEDFEKHYSTEQAEIITLNHQVNKVIGGLDVALEKLAADRPIFLEMLENKKLKKVENE